MKKGREGGIGFRRAGEKGEENELKLHIHTATHELLRQRQSERAATTNWCTPAHATSALPAHTRTPSTPQLTPPACGAHASQTAPPGRPAPRCPPPQQSRSQQSARRCCCHHRCCWSHHWGRCCWGRHWWLRAVYPEDLMPPQRLVPGGHLHAVGAERQVFELGREWGATGNQRQGCANHNASNSCCSLTWLSA